MLELLLDDVEFTDHFAHTFRPFFAAFPPRRVHRVDLENVRGNS